MSSSSAVRIPLAPKARPAGPLIERGRAPQAGRAPGAWRRAPGVWLRWAPSLTSVVFLVAILLAFDTPPVDVARFFGYGVWAVILPGTLVYRALRRTPHSLVDDLAMGSAV